MKKVIIYSTPTCTYCLMAKDFFREKGVEFEEIDVSGSEEKREELLKLTDGQMGVPVIVIDGTVVFGFDKNGIEELLK
ncbi:NrdH-redoxin [Candidatus Campbellbacteria bacterium RIFOXYC2_FULL_35_25]|uniref:NrdH-redoxin n=1 Tax=Candidatus Campbellbacteria bacterium RIFOXYC2_FULL_35_25 TaxID=1797582 RepID=A0A1F5EJ71_9BACT|nr:MAG: NrdH-redoxin [Candidatus Campbellbacteria bacterium RIFOXYC2_FULL_35_25]